MLGFAVPQYGDSARSDLARFAETVEDLGGDSLWVGHPLITAVQPSVGYAGADTIPEQFRTGQNPFGALAVAATVTSRVRLGSSVLVALWYLPVQLGRQLTALNVVSRGRLLPGFGIGWSIPPSWVDLKPVQQPAPIYLASFTAAGRDPSAIHTYLRAERLLPA